MKKVKRPETVKAIGTKAVKVTGKKKGQKVKIGDIGKVKTT